MMYSSVAVIAKNCVSTILANFSIALNCMDQFSRDHLHHKSVSIFGFKYTVLSFEMNMIIPNSHQGLLPWVKNYRK